MKHIQLAFLVLGMAMSADSQAQYQSSTRGMLNYYASMVEDQCARAIPEMEQAAQGDQKRLEAARKFEKYVCQCHPQKTRELIAKLSEQQLAEQISDEAEYLALTKPAILAPCAGEMLRSTFGGESCEAMKSMPGVKLDVDVACPCMRQELPAYSDEDAMALGLEFANYIPALNEALKAGKPPPARSALLTRFGASMKKCGVQGPLVD